MQFREHPGVMGKRDAYPFDPRMLKIDEGYNVRDLKAPDEQDALAELKESIRANGVRVPLEVRLAGEDVFVVAGHRRHIVVMELIEEGEDIKSVPVIPEPKGTNEADRILNLVVSNSGRPLKPLEVAEVVRRLIAFGWDKTQIAKRMGWKSPGSVSGYLDMMALSEPVKQHVRDGQISATLAKNIAKGVDPKVAEEMIRANLEENRRIKGKPTRVTNKTLKRDNPKAVTRFTEQPAAKPDPEPAPFVAEVEISDEQRIAVETAAAAMRDQLASALPAPQETELHPQLQTAAEREQPRSMTTVLKEVEAIVPPIRTFPPEALQPPAPARLVDREMLLIIGKFAVIAEDNCLNERADDELIQVPAKLIKEADRIYRQRIGDTSADEAA